MRGPSPLYIEERREVPEAIGWQNNGEENAEPAQKTWKDRAEKKGPTGGTG